VVSQCRLELGYIKGPLLWHHHRQPKVTFPESGLKISPKEILFPRLKRDNGTGLFIFSVKRVRPRRQPHIEHCAILNPPNLSPIAVNRRLEEAAYILLVAVKMDRGISRLRWLLGTTDSGQGTKGTQEQ